MGDPGSQVGGDEGLPLPRWRWSPGWSWAGGDMEPKDLGAQLAKLLRSHRVRLIITDQPMVRDHFLRHPGPGRRHPRRFRWLLFYPGDEGNRSLPLEILSPLPLPLRSFSALWILLMEKERANHRQVFFFHGIRSPFFVGNKEIPA